ncbi:MAG: hypothetical protein VX589_15735 [Myxococcota bacterium]|nr:hypothetical protein [Myxococcota bacterium]
MKFLFLPAIACVGACILCTRAQADCPVTEQVQLALSSDQFALSAYDVRQGLLAVKTLAHTHRMPNRTDAIQLTLPQAPIFVPVGPQRLRWLLERGVNQVEVVLDAVRSTPTVSGPVRTPCGQWSVRGVRLKQDGIVLARHQVAIHKSDRARDSLAAKVHVERGHAPKAKIREFSHRLASQCRDQVRRYGHTVQGAVSVQLDMDLLGRAQPPRIVVDGLVNQQLSHCLRTKLSQARGIWQSIEPSTRVYLTFYFKGPSPP